MANGIVMMMCANAIVDHIARKAVLGEELQQREAEDEPRQAQWRKEQALQDHAAEELMPRERDGRHRAERGRCDNPEQNATTMLTIDGVDELGTLGELDIPLEAQPGGGNTMNLSS